jgi:Family of unknown function (DUF6516)
MQAKLLYRHRQGFDDGMIVEAVIWLLPNPIKGSRHHYKYRLYYGRPGQRIIGYDNERGKGDHRHYRGKEAVYRFVSPEKLMEDFISDVEAERKPL